MESEYMRPNSRNHMHNMYPSNMGLTGSKWVYRCDDCDWSCYLEADPVSCPQCDGDTNRAPHAVVEKFILAG